MRLYWNPEYELAKVLERRTFPKGAVREMAESIIGMLKGGRPDNATESMGWTLCLYAKLQEMCRLGVVAGLDMSREQKAIVQYMKRRCENDEQ